MVVGVRALLQEGRTYSYGDLQSAFGLDEDQFPLAFDTLVRTRRIRLVIFDRGFAALSPFERDLLWRVAGGKAQGLRHGKEAVWIRGRRDSLPFPPMRSKSPGRGGFALQPAVRIRLWLDRKGLFSRLF